MNSTNATRILEKIIEKLQQQVEDAPANVTGGVATVDKPLNGRKIVKRPALETEEEEKDNKEDS